MKGFIIITPRLFKLVAADFVTGMALFPFILLKHESDKTNSKLLNHERIHLKQQLELLIIPFYLWYGLEYLAHRLKGKKHYAAYRSISFEREAYSNENNQLYLKNRKIWNFLKY